MTSLTMNSVGRFFLDSRTVRVAWTILVILATLGLAYALRGVLLLVALGDIARRPLGHPAPGRREPSRLSLGGEFQ